MKILGINTATTNLSIALIDQNKVLAEKTIQAATAKAEQLIPWVQELLQKAGLKLADLEGVGIAQGPGAFTGLRIGVTTAKTLSQMLNIPIVGISTIKAFARQYILNKQISLLRIILNACRGEFNTGLFQIKNGELLQVEDDHPEKAEDLWQKIRQEKSSLAGDIPEEYHDRKLSGEPQAVSIAEIAQQQILAQQYADPHTLVPVYSHGPNIKLSPRIHQQLIKDNGH